MSVSVSWGFGYSLAGRPVFLAQGFSTIQWRQYVWFLDVSPRCVSPHAAPVQTEASRSAFRNKDPRSIHLLHLLVYSILFDTLFLFS